MPRYPLYLFLLFVCSCTSPSSNKTESDLLVFDPTQVPFSEITLSDIADEITYIQFDTTFLFIGFNPTVLLNEDYIIIYAANLGLLKYSIDGKFMAKIGGIGQGPGEYDQHNKTIGGDCDKYFFVGGYRDDILCYDLDGKFLKK